MPLNEHGQPVGEPVTAWTPPPRPSRAVMAGPHARLEPLDAARHLDDLYSACCEPANDAGWTYLPYGPFADREGYAAWLTGAAASEDPLFFAIVDPATGRAAGVASYMRVTPAAGTIEIGHLHFGPAMRGRPLATGALAVMMAGAFALGYRRLEWKCDALNAPSRAAAARLGFAFEGVFRQAAVVRGRNRDTAWFSITDGEWPALAAAFETWLADGNFDGQGRQRQALSALTRAALEPVRAC
jgi:RimJ/RimL family protein N-acetyltransferase